MTAGDRTTVVRVALAAMAVSAALVVASVTTRYVAYRIQVGAPGSEPIAALRWFDVNSERNVPTTWSVALLLGAAVVAAVVAARRRRPADGVWWAVAAVAAYLALDEWFELHERLGDVGEAIGGSVLHFAWVIPAVVVAGVVGVVLLRLFADQPAIVRRRLVVAGLVYLFGALGLETVSGLVLREQGAAALYLVVTAAEELCEMVGASLLLATAVGALQPRMIAPRGSARAR